MPDVHGLTVLSIFDADTGDAVQLNALGDDSEVLVRAPFDGDGVKNPLGGQFYGGDVSRVSVTSLDWDAHPTLEAWMKTGRRLSAAGVGPTGALLWQEQDLITVMPETVKGALGGARGFRVTMERTGHGSHAVYWESNLLDFLGWADNDADVYPDGWTTEGTEAGGFTVDGLCSVASDDSGATSLSATVLFPVAGVLLTGSLGVDQDGGFSAAVTGLDYDDEVLSDTTDVLSSTSDDGRLLLPYTTPPDVWSLRFAPATKATSGGTASIGRPALRVGAFADPCRLGPGR